MEAGMMKKIVGIGLILLGDLLLIVALAADELGIGNVAGIGWKQVSGVAAGIVLQLVGIVLSQLKSKTAEPAK